MCGYVGVNQGESVTSLQACTCSYIADCSNSTSRQSGLKIKGVCDLLQSTLTYLLLQPVTRKSDEGMEEEDEGAEEEAELMQNKEFLQSVLSTLPGVNPEEALQNLEQMTQEEEEEEEKDKEVSGKSYFFQC